MPTLGLGFVVDWPTANEMAGKVLVDFGLPTIDLRTLVRDPSVARQQIVELAKALVSEPRNLVLDEPTAVLSASEANAQFTRIKALTAAGTTILYISHRLEEIFEVTDEVVVLEDGQSVLQGDIARLDQGWLIEAMVGRPCLKRCRGAADLLEMPEVLGLSDRLLIMREGRIVAELLPDDFRMQTVFSHAAGLTPAAGERLN